MRVKMAFQHVRIVMAKVEAVVRVDIREEQAAQLVTDLAKTLVQENITQAMV
jgi:hypothetical protein